MLQSPFLGVDRPIERLATREALNKVSIMPSTGNGEEYTMDWIVYAMAGHRDRFFHAFQRVNRTQVQSEIKWD